MLPIPARRTPHQVSRARLQRHRHDIFPAVASGRPKRPQTHARRVCERDSRDDFELRHVTMPAQRRSRSVFADEAMHERLGRQAGPKCYSPAQWQQEFRQRRRGIESISLEIVFGSENECPAACRALLEPRFFQWQGLDLPEQF